MVGRAVKLGSGVVTGLPAGEFEDVQAGGDAGPDGLGVVHGAAAAQGDQSAAAFVLIKLGSFTHLADRRVGLGGVVNDAGDAGLVQDLANLVRQAGLGHARVGHDQGFVVF